MIALWIPLAVGAVATWGALPWVRRLVLRAGVVDLPNHRSSHTQPTPRGAGIACAVGLVAATTAARLSGLNVPWAATLAVLGLAAVGLADDRSSLQPQPRLAAQLVTGAGLGWFIGGLPFLVAGLLLFPLMVNVVNFMDGINGISGATMSVWGLTAMWAGLGGNAVPLAVLGAAAVGMSVGFLPWNVPRAHMFLGDVGSYLFGATIAAGVLVGAQGQANPALLIAPTSIYLTDVLVTLWRRGRRRAPLTEAHREHIYQRLTSEFRFSHVVVAALVSGLALLSALAWATTTWWLALAVTGALCTAYAASPQLGPVLQPQQRSTADGVR